MNASNAKKKVFIKTYGCQMNVYDSDRMADSLKIDGYETTDQAEDADLILLNTCHIREKAAEKVYSELGRLKALKAGRSSRGRDTMIGVAGCVAQAEGEEIIRRAPVVDLVVGPQSYHRLPEVVSRAESGAHVVETEFPPDDKFAHLPAQSKRTIRDRGVTAFLTVQEGCDKFCAFCVVPYTRGAEFSRPAVDVMKEARRLADAGVREITLLGQNVNAWHGIAPSGGHWGLGDLLYRLAEIPGLARLRYTTSHPLDMDDGLIAAHRDLPQLMPYLHLPVQSGSNAILKAMNRRHTRDDYLRVVDRIRSARPDIALSGDFIVGFPGETDADFEETLSIVDAVGYAQAYSFKYSQRPGTPAADADGHVPDTIKSERLAALQERISALQNAFNRSFLGARMDLLLEKPGRRDGQLVGRSPWLQAVQVDADRDKIGEIVPITIENIGANSLFGTLTYGDVRDPSLKDPQIVGAAT